MVGRNGAVALVLVVCGSVQAAPEDDFLTGRTAYHRGDVVAAMAALQRASRAGHGGSHALLAFILDRSDQPDEAARLYQAAAAQDEPEGHAGLANLYLTGRGIAKDEKAAWRHFSKAADLGHGASIAIVADALRSGRIGATALPADDALTQRALRRAAEAEHTASIDALALAYEQGRFGLAPDAAQAAAWRARAAAVRAPRTAAAGASR